MNSQQSTQRPAVDTIICHGQLVSLSHLTVISTSARRGLPKSQLQSGLSRQRDCHHLDIISGRGNMSAFTSIIQILHYSLFLGVMGRPAVKVGIKVSSAAQTYYIQVPPVQFPNSQYPNFNYTYVWPYNLTTTTTVAPTYRPIYTVPAQQFSGVPQVVNCSGMSCYTLLPLVPSDFYSQTPYYSWGWRSWASRYWSACAWFMC
uniref:Uncharacterized protein n=1 Tax=Graphocephala atropunctata TaxID=36148 RepID=A0A1B6KS56_9HEMI